MKYRVKNHGPSHTFEREGEPSVTIPHTGTGSGVVLELPPELANTLSRGGNHAGVSLQRVADDAETHQPAGASGLRVIVRQRLDWPQLGFVLEQGITHADTLDAWVASVPEPVRAKLAPFVRAHDVRLLDLGTNPVAEVGARAVELLEAAAS